MREILSAHSTFKFITRSNTMNKTTLAQAKAESLRIKARVKALSKDMLSAMCEVDADIQLIDRHLGLPCDVIPLPLDRLKLDIDPAAQNAGILVLRNYLTSARSGERGYERLAEIRSLIKLLAVPVAQ
jgi:hypothetical protein